MLAVKPRCFVPGRSFLFFCFCPVFGGIIIAIDSIFLVRQKKVAEEIEAYILVEKQREGGGGKRVGDLQRLDFGLLHGLIGLLCGRGRTIGSYFTCIRAPS
jgi:hypothetical protein